MAILTPLLYQSLAEREGYPTIQADLARGLDERFAPWGGDTPASSFGWMIDEFPIATFLRPVDLLAAATSELIGVPVLTSSATREFLADLAITDREARLGTMWLEFWPTMHDSYAVFLADRDPVLRTPVLRLLPTAGAVQLHLFDLGLTVSEDRELHRDEPSEVPAGPCVLEARQNEPGAPYRGTCANEGCVQGCDPLILLSPDDGIYRLAGCDC